MTPNQILLITVILSLLNFILVRYIYIYLIDKYAKTTKLKELFTIYVPLLLSILLTLIVYQYLLLTQFDIYIPPIVRPPIVTF